MTLPEDELGGPPKSDWARLVPELAVSNLDGSLGFWRDLLGFAVAYRRPAERFVYLEQHGAQVMLCQRHGRYETGPMERPFGQETGQRQFFVQDSDGYLLMIAQDIGSRAVRRAD